MALNGLQSLVLDQPLVRNGHFHVPPSCQVSFKLRVSSMYGRRDEECGSVAWAAISVKHCQVAHSVDVQLCRLLLNYKTYDTSEEGYLHNILDACAAVRHLRFAVDCRASDTTLYIEASRLAMAQLDFDLGPHDESSSRLEIVVGEWAEDAAVAADEGACRLRVQGARKYSWSCTTAGARCLARSLAALSISTSSNTGNGSTF